MMYFVPYLSRTTLNGLISQSASSQSAAFYHYQQKISVCIIFFAFSPLMQQEWEAGLDANRESFDLNHDPVQFFVIRIFSALKH